MGSDKQSVMPPTYSKDITVISCFKLKGLKCKWPKQVSYNWKFTGYLLIEVSVLLSSNTQSPKVLVVITIKTKNINILSYYSK